MNQDPFRLRLVKNLTDLLRTITPANGFMVDLSDSVFRGRAVFGDGDPIPMVSILEAVKTVESLRVQPDGSQMKNVWPLLIQGWTEDDIDGNPTDPAHHLMAAVKQCIAKHRIEHARDYNWLGMGGAITDIRYNGGVVRPPEVVSDKSFFWLLLDVELVEDLLNPYA